MDIKTIIDILVIILAVVYAIVWFIKLPKAKKISNIKEWLKYAVVEAEKELGSGTGQLKLRFVYSMTLKRFPFMIKLIPFSLFSEWVDEALHWMNSQLEENEKITEYIDN